MRHRVGAFGKLGLDPSLESLRDLRGLALDGIADL